MKALRRIILSVSGLIFLVSVAWLWLMHTTSGARLVVERAASAAGADVAVVDGAIARGLELEGIRYSSDGVEATVATLSAKIDISVLPSSVGILDARAHGVRVTIPGGERDGDVGPDASGILESLVLRFPLHIDDFRATDIVVAIDDRTQVIDSLALTATWHEDIQVQRLAIGAPELDADGEVSIDLGNGNRMTSNVLLGLKPALTGASEPVAVRVRTEGDLTGARVLATVEAFASVDGRVQWQDELEAAVDVTLEKLELANFVDDWPAGFPVDGKLHLAVDNAALRLHDSSLEIGGTNGRLLIDGGLQRADYGVEARLQWEQLRWPLPESETRVRSAMGDLRVSGTVDGWMAVGTIAVVAGELPPGTFEIEGKGNRDSASGRIVDSSVLGGRASGEVAYTWKDQQPWRARLELASVDLTALFPDWPAVVSGRLDSEGTVEPFAMHAMLEGVRGVLRGESIGADGIVDIADGNVSVSGLRVDHGDSSASLDGALMTPQGLRFDARIADLSLYADSLGGEVVATGAVSLADAGFVDATLRSPHLSINDLVLTGLEVRLQGSDAGQTVGLVGIYEDTPFEAVLSGAFADWRKPRASQFQGEFRTLEIDLGDEHSMTMSEPALVTFAGGEFAVENFCLSAEVGASLCGAAQWKESGDYGVKLTLQNVPLDFIEHVADSPLLFDQRVSGTLDWQHSFGAGPRGSGQLTLSAGTMALVEEPENLVATGEGILDFDIERGRLLRGDIVLPFPGRGQVSGAFAVEDVRLGIESGVAGKLEVDLSSIRTLSRLAPLVDNASGALRARINLAGTVTEPQWSGELSLEDGAFSYSPIGIELTEVNLDGAMDPDFRFDISGTFRAGQGKAEIVSRADYSNTDEPGLMFRIRGEQLTVVNVPDVFVEADADIDIALDSEAITINGAVSVPNARIRPRNITGRKVSESEDVVIVAGELPDLPEEAQKRSDLEFQGELNVSLGDAVFVDLDLAKAKISGAVNFNWQGGAMPVANGRYLIEGNIAAFGQVLDIAEGSVLFPQVPADQPYVRIRAEREIYGNTQIRRAGVLVDGPVRRPTVEAYTQPLTTEERALTLLVTGSDFDFEQGIGAVDFGTYIAPRLFVSYGVGVFDRENIISARFDLARGFGIKASSGSKESGVDLNYRFEN
jgi:translocation and assembly module TamB